MTSDKKIKDKVRVGVLRGGLGEDYQPSVARGGEVILYILENLSPKYKPFDVLVDQNGLWHLNGVPIEPSKLLYKVDVVWNASHQSFSNILESFSIPNVGIPPFMPFFGKNKEILREHMKKIGVQIPRYILNPKNAKEVFEKFSSPWIVNGKLVKTFSELTQAINNESTILIEEFIVGKNASLYSVSGFRNQDTYIFPINSSSGGFSRHEKEKLITLAKAIHNHIGAKHYLKSNIILRPRGKIYLTDIDIHPDLKTNSHFSQVCESVGAKVNHMIEHILEKTLR